MSMTRKEAIAILQEEHDYCKPFCALAARREEDCPEIAKYLQALQIALSALRPVSREKVEKVWRGEWNNINPVVLKPGVPWVCRCAKCGCPQDYRHNFCPNCGEAKTDGAVVMVMERLEKARSVKE